MSRTCGGGNRLDNRRVKIWSNDVFDVGGESIQSCLHIYRFARSKHVGKRSDDKMRNIGGRSETRLANDFSNARRRGTKARESSLRCCNRGAVRSDGGNEYRDRAV